MPSVRNNDISRRAGQTLIIVALTTAMIALTPPSSMPDNESVAQDRTSGSIDRLQPIPQTGHVWPVHLMAFAGPSAGPGKAGPAYVVTESAQGIIVWDAETGKQLQNIATRETGTRLSPDRRAMIYTTGTGPRATLCVHRLGEISPYLRIQLPEQCGIRSVCFTADGKSIVARGDEFLHVWSSDDGQLVERIEVARYDSPAVVALQKQFAGGVGVPTGSTDILAHLETLKRSASGLPLILAGRNPIGFEGTFSPDGRIWVSVNWHDTGSRTEDVALWDFATGKLLHFFQGPMASPQHVVWLPSAEQYVTGIGHLAAELHRSATGEKLLTFGEFTAEIRSLAISRSGRWLIVGTDAGELSAWDLRSGQKISETKLDGPIQDLTLVSDDQVAVASRTVHKFSLPRLQTTGTIPLPATRLLFDSSTDRLLVGHGGPYQRERPPRVTLHDARSGNKIQSIMRTPNREMLLSPNGLWALGIPRLGQVGRSTSEFAIPLWNVDSGEVVHTFPAGSAKFDYHYPPSEAIRRDIVATPSVSSAGVDTLHVPHSRGRKPPDFGLDPAKAGPLPDASAIDSATRQWLQSLIAQTAPIALEGPQLMRDLGANDLQPTVWNSGAHRRVIAHYREGKVAHRYTVADMVPTAATVNQDGTQVLVAFRSPDRQSKDKTIAVFRAEDGQLLEQYDATQPEMSPSWWIDAITLSPDDSYLAVGYDYHTYFLDRKSKKLMLAGKGQEGLPGRDIVIFSPDSKRAVVLGYRRLLWDLENEQSLLDLGAYNDPHSITFSPTGRTLFVNGNDGPRLIDAATGDVRYQAHGEQAELRFSPDGSRMVLLKYNVEAISLWDFDRATRICQLNNGDMHDLMDVQFTPTGKKLVTLESEGGGATLTVRDADTGEIVSQHRRATDPFGYRGNQPRPTFLDGDRLLTVQPQSVTVWDLKTAAPLHHFPAQSAFCGIVRRGDDRLLVISPGVDATLWSLETGEALRTFRDLPNDLTQPRAVTYSDRGDRLFARYRRGQSLRVWDGESGSMLSRHHLVDEGRRWLSETADDDGP